MIHIFKDNFYITNDKTDLFKKVFFLLDATGEKIKPHGGATLVHTHLHPMAEIQRLLMFSNSVKGFYEMFVKKNHRAISLLLLTFYVMIHVTYVYLSHHMVKL